MSEEGGKSEEWAVPEEREVLQGTESFKKGCCQQDQVHPHLRNKVSIGLISLENYL